MIAGALEYFERTPSKGRRIIRGTEGLSKIRQKKLFESREKYQRCAHLKLDYSYLHSQEKNDSQRKSMSQKTYLRTQGG